VDFETLGKLSAVAKKGLRSRRRGAARREHLPKEAFNEFAKADAIEVHLATGFQNLVFDHPRCPGAQGAGLHLAARESAGGAQGRDDGTSSSTTPPASAASARRGSRRRGGTCPPRPSARS